MGEPPRSELYVSGRSAAPTSGAPLAHNPVADADAITPVDPPVAEIVAAPVAQSRPLWTPTPRRRERTTQGVVARRHEDPMAAMMKQMRKQMEAMSMSMFGDGMLDGMLDGGEGQGGTTSFFSSSSVVVMGGGEGEEPYYESRTVARGPGYEQATRQIQDPTSGHTQGIRRRLGDRGFDLVRQSDLTGNVSSHSNYVGMAESDFPAFQQQWSSSTPSSLAHPHRANNYYLS